MVTLYYNGTSIDIQEDDSSYRYRTLMGEDSITLKFALNEAIDFPVGTHMTFQGRTYTLTSPESWRRMGRSYLEYTLILESEASRLANYKLINQQDGRLKFSMTARPAEFLNLIIQNLEARGLSWSYVCNVEAVEKTLEFNHNNLLEALNALTETFETEYEISDDNTIVFGKVEYNKDNPLPLALGKGKGFISGTGRTNDGENKPIDILYVQGGSKNIDRSTYGSAELLLPRNKTLIYNDISYTSSDDGRAIWRTDDTELFDREGSLDLSDIYPKREGVVTSVKLVDEKNHFYDFSDNTIPEDLNYNDYLINGETMTVIFQSGMLAGKEFELSKYNHTERKFEIVPQEFDGITMPSGNFIPRENDTYAIFGCTLPPAYIADNDTQTGAEWDMFTEAARHLYDNSAHKFSYTGELQAKWVKENWENVGGRIKIGSYIRFTDEYFAPKGADIRITGIKDYLGAPYSPTIELSNNIRSSSSLSSNLKKPAQNEVTIDDKHKEAVAFTKRGFRDLKETSKMLKEAVTGFSEDISPITVNTMQIILGDESLQFRFVNNSTDAKPISHAIIYDPQKKILTADAGVLQHMTLGIDELKSSHETSEYKFWSIPKFESPFLGDDLAQNAYFLYAKCSKETETGEFYLTTEAQTMDATGYYYFLVGVLNKERNGGRSYTSVYGFTEILPGQITTDVIRSADGKTYFNLRDGVIGGKIKFISSSGEDKWVSDFEDEQKKAYEDAMKAADDAMKEAEKANEKLSDWSADGVISPLEMQGVKDEYAFVVADKKDIDTEAERYDLKDGDTYKAFSSAYSTYAGDLKAIVEAATEIVAIPAKMDEHQSDYYTKRSAILSAIAKAAKDFVTNSYSDAMDAAQEAKDAAQEALDAAGDAMDEADAAKKKMEAWTADDVISPLEKQGIKNELAFIEGDKMAIKLEVNRYGLLEHENWTLYETYYNSYHDELTYIIESELENVPVGNNLANTQSWYYLVRAQILEQIAITAKQIADDAYDKAQEALDTALGLEGDLEAIELVASAIKDGSTYVDGGLILTNMMMLGDMGGTYWAGVNGVKQNDNTPAFWGGGSYGKATNTVDAYAENPSYKPTAEELANMAKFVVTHGGKLIAVDGIFRGSVYAENGVFSGRLQCQFMSIESDHTLTLNDATSIHLQGTMGGATLTLPRDDNFDGWMLNIVSYPIMSKLHGTGSIAGSIACPHLGNAAGDWGLYQASRIDFPNGGCVQLIYNAVLYGWTVQSIAGVGIEYTF